VWASAPGVPEPPDRWPVAVRVVLHLVTLLAGPVTRAAAMPTLRPALVAGALALGAVATSLLGERRWLPRAVVVVALTAVVALAEGRSSASGPVPASRWPTGGFAAGVRFPPATAPCRRWRS
jgi:hypothetical protein